MKRLLHTLVLLAGLLALAPFAAPAYARPHAALIVCPLTSGQAVIPCCGPPVAMAGPAASPCCVTPQPIACPTGLTIGSAPDPSSAGNKVTIAGRWLGSTAGTIVQLWQKLPGGATFKQVAQTTTGTTGQYQFVRGAVETSRQWYVTAGASRSVTIEQQVRATVTLTRLLRVHVSPNHAGERVLIERRTRQGWKVIARPRLTRSSSSNGSVPVAIGRGTFVLRAVFPGDGRNVRSVSPLVQIKR